MSTALSFVDWVTTYLTVQVRRFDFVHSKALKFWYIKKMVRF